MKCDDHDTLIHKQVLVLILLYHAIVAKLEDEPNSLVCLKDVLKVLISKKKKKISAIFKVFANIPSSDGIKPSAVGWFPKELT